MPKNSKSKNLSGQDVIKAMRQIGAGIEHRLGTKIGNVEKKLGGEIGHLGVQIESVEHKIDLVIERQNGMDESINSKLGSISNKVDKLTTDVDVIRLDVIFIKDGLKKKADASETVTLRRRVTLLEGSK